MRTSANNVTAKLSYPVLVKLGYGMQTSLDRLELDDCAYCLSEVCTYVIHFPVIETLSPVIFKLSAYISNILSIDKQS